MSGIVGFCDFSKKSAVRELTSMLRVLDHRGPDADGHSIYSYATATLGLGHQRLSILALSETNNQPTSFGHLEIVYDGKVYNFREIKHELETLDYSFNSHNDAEVVLKAYHCWGLDALEKFNGMFAMAILNKEDESLTLIRDRAGVKPLYWYFEEGLFLFASELKSFHQHPNFSKKINKDVLGQYLQHGYVLQPYSIFKSTEQLNSGHILRLDIKTQMIQKKEYWSLSSFYAKPKFELTDNEAIVKTEEILKKSFDSCMLSDVPVGIFLSGGYDSSILTALLQIDRDKKINTFTIGFGKKDCDESPYAKNIAKHLGTNHTEHYCTHKDALDIIPKLAEIYDEPFGDASVLPSILISQLAKEKVSVCLSADGGDEIFAGATSYAKLLHIDDTLTRVPSLLKKGGAGILNMVNPAFIPLTENMYDFEIRYEKLKKMLRSESASELLELSYEQYSKDELNKLLINKPLPLKTNFSSDVSSIEDRLSQLLMIDYKTHLADNILTKIDRATMSVGLEGREPFLDSSIIEFAAQLPNEMKHRDGESKWILKQIGHKYLPHSIMKRPSITSSPPITEWFRDELKSYFLYYLSHERLSDEGLFNADEVIHLRDEYLAGKNVSVHRLWYILMFEMWYERWM